MAGCQSGLSSRLAPRNAEMIPRRETELEETIVYDEDLPCGKRMFELAREAMAIEELSARLSRVGLSPYEKYLCLDADAVMGKLPENEKRFFEALLGSSYPENKKRIRSQKEQVAFYDRDQPEALTELLRGLSNGLTPLDAATRVIERNPDMADDPGLRMFELAAEAILIMTQAAAWEQRNEAVDGNHYQAVICEEADRMMPSLNMSEKRALEHFLSPDYVSPEDRGANWKTPWEMMDRGAEENEEGGRKQGGPVRD